MKLRDLLILFLYIFGPVFRPIGEWFDLTFFTSLFIIASSQYKSWRKVRYPLTYLKWVFIVGLYAIFLIVLEEGASFSLLIRYLLKPIRILVIALAGYVLANLYTQKRQYSYSTIVHAVFYVIGLHALIMVIQLISPDIKDLIYDYTAYSEFRSSYDYNFRMGGLSGGSGGAVLSVVQSIGVLLFPFLSRSNKVNQLFNLGFLGLILVSVFISGRSGVWSIILFLPLSYMMKNSGSAYKLIKSMFRLGVLAVLMVTGTVYFMEAMNAESEWYYAFRRSLDSFIGYSESQEFNVSTFDILLKHVKLPDSFVNFFFGNGEHLVYTGFDRTLQSDIGYIRNIWSFGLIGSVMFIFPLGKYLQIALKYRKKIEGAALVVILCTLMLMFHGKENFLYVRMFWSIVSLIFGVFVVQLRNNAEKTS